MRHTVTPNLICLSDKNLKFDDKELESIKERISQIREQILVQQTTPGSGEVVACYQGKGEKVW